MIPIKLISSEWAQLLLSCGIRNISGAIIMPMGMAAMPLRANDDDDADVKANMVEIDFI